MSTPTLELKEIRKSFGGIRAVDGVSLRVGAGERVAVIGPNGAGKSTLFGLISGELRADAGEVLVEGASVRKVAPERRARLGLGTDVSDGEAVRGAVGAGERRVGPDRGRARRRRRAGRAGGGGVG